MARPILTLEERFMSHVEPEPMSGCWLWTGEVNRDGYGKFYSGPPSQKRSRLAHRISYSLFVAEFNAELDVLHSCDVPSCVCPSHLFIGTAQDNLSDMAKKGRGAKSKSGSLYGVNILSDKPRRKPFAARVCIGRTVYRLGTFTTAEQASAVATAFKASKLAGLC